MPLSLYLFFYAYLFIFVFCSCLISHTNMLSLFVFFFFLSWSLLLLDHLPFISIFFFFLSWLDHLSTTSTSLHYKHHKNQNLQEPTPLTHKHRSPPPALIHKHPNSFLSTHKLWSLPPTPIHQPTSDQHQHWSLFLLVCPSGCVYISLCWFETKFEEKFKTKFILHMMKREKKRCEIVKLIK